MEKFRALRMRGYEKIEDKIRKTRGRDIDTDRQRERERENRDTVRHTHTHRQTNMNQLIRGIRPPYPYPAPR